MSKKIIKFPEPDHQDQLTVAFRTRMEVLYHNLEGQPEMQHLVVKAFETALERDGLHAQQIAGVTAMAQELMKQRDTVIDENAFLRTVLKELKAFLEGDE